jgi:hypothetical protein
MKKVLTLIIMLFSVVAFSQNNFPCIQIMSTGTPELFKIKSIFPKDKLMVEEFIYQGEKKYRIMIICKDKAEALEKKLHYSREFYDAFVTMRSQVQIDRMFPFEFQFAIKELDNFKTHEYDTRSMISANDAEFLLNTLFYKYEERSGIRSHKSNMNIKDLPYYMYYALDIYDYNLVSNRYTSDAIEEIIFAWMGDMNN